MKNRDEQREMPGTNCGNGGGAEIDWGTLSLSGEGKVTPRRYRGFRQRRKNLVSRSDTVESNGHIVTNTICLYVCLTALLLHLESSEIRSALCV